MSRRAFIAGALGILIVAALVRTVWLTADPPNTATAGVGIVWHDEGPWVHNARNRVLWGVWRSDNWNPMFLTPVFTTLEYVAFQALGVGTSQARIVPAVSGIAAVAFLMIGLAALQNRLAAVVGGALLAINYVFVMWNRAALMESSMSALIVISWAAYAVAERRPRWGAIAGLAAVLAFFTKASAAFFVGALVIDAMTTRAFAWSRRNQPASTSATTAADWTLAAVAVSGVAALVLFALPHWQEFRFYNWQMSVTRKPDYTVRALVTRASWLPIVHDFFTWMWPLFVVACVSMLHIIRHWRMEAPAKRLLVLWVIVGFAELVVHDSGNERRYVMFIPALLALATIHLFPRLQNVKLVGGVPAPRSWMSVPFVAALSYLAIGSLLRLFFLDQVRAGHLHTTVVLSASIAVAVTIAWQRDWLLSLAVRTRMLQYRPDFRGVDSCGRGRVPLRAVGSHRQYTNHSASIELGRILATRHARAGQTRERHVARKQDQADLIGHGFGNYDDRLQRDDVRYILTYTSPSLGFESQAGSDMIQQILNRYPERRVVATFDVNETGGPDRAALIDKSPGTTPRAPN